MASTTPEAIAQQKKIVHFTSLAAIVVSPILIALPPRKFDKYTVALLTTTALGANQLVREQTGWSIAQRITFEAKRLYNTEHAMPSARAEEVRALLRAEKAAREANSQRGMPAHTTTAEEVRAFVAKEKAEREAQGMDTSVLDALMAKEVAESKKSEWKRKRDEHERKSLEEGKSYGDLIMEQIWDVVSWGKGTAEEVKPADERQAAVQEAMREGSAKSVLTVLEVDGEKKEK